MNLDHQLVARPFELTVAQAGPRVLEPRSSALHRPVCDACREARQSVLRVVHQQLFLVAVKQVDKGRVGPPQIDDGDADKAVLGGNAKVVPALVMKAPPQGIALEFSLKPRPVDQGWIAAIAAGGGAAIEHHAVRCGAEMFCVLG